MREIEILYGKDYYGKQYLNGEFRLNGTKSPFKVRLQGNSKNPYQKEEQMSVLSAMSPLTMFWMDNMRRVLDCDRITGEIVSPRSANNKIWDYNVSYNFRQTSEYRSEFDTVMVSVLNVPSGQLIDQTRKMIKYKQMPKNNQNILLLGNDEDVMVKGIYTSLYEFEVVAVPSIVTMELFYYQRDNTDSILLSCPICDVGYMRQKLDYKTREYSGDFQCNKCFFH